jgi:hypothetical protein
MSVTVFYAGDGGKPGSEKIDDVPSTGTPDVGRRATASLT